MPLVPEEVRRHLQAYDEALSYVANKKGKKELAELDRLVSLHAILMHRDAHMHVAYCLECTPGAMAGLTSTSAFQGSVKFKEGGIELNWAF
jgi:hypothetical protein